MSGGRNLFGETVPKFFRTKIIAYMGIGDRRHFRCVGGFPQLDQKVHGASNPGPEFIVQHPFFQIIEKHYKRSSLGLDVQCPYPWFSKAVAKERR